MILALLLLIAAPSTADPSLAPWFQSLQAPSGMSCCALADGHILKDSEWRIVGDHYEILVAGKWIEVPADAVLNQVENPTGGAVAFYPPSGAPPLYCFVRPSET